MTPTPPHRHGPNSTRTTGPAPTEPPGSHPARPAVAPTGKPGGLSCPECREAARAVPPTEWPLDGFEPRPAYSHLDGTALCPVADYPGGSGPAEPVTVPARLTLREAVRQSWLIHPDWTVTDHLGWLDDEAYDLDAVEGDPATVVGEWLAEHHSTEPNAGSPRADDTTTSPAPVPEVVYLVAGGDMVAVFADEEAAVIQDNVMTLANLDTVARRLTWARWVQVRAELRARYPEIEIIDVSGGDPS